MARSGSAWDPGERPAWVRAALDGRAGTVFEAGTMPFDAEQLLAEAEFRAGSTEWGGTSHLEPLNILVRSIEDEADLHLVGRWRVREVVLRYLENRLRIVAALRADPAILDERIEAPIVVTGSPRAGTSIMHQLLSLRSDARAPLAWEYWAPAPPPTSATNATDPRIPLANRDVRMSAALAPMFDGMHEQGALLPREDASAMGVDLRSDVLGAHYGVPSYREWMATCDMTSGYGWHRHVLQVLQRHVPTDRWVVKWPTHVAYLPTLLETYPDARIVVCHRDPVAMLSSVTSLTATLRWCHAESVDYAAVAQEQLTTFARQCDQLVEWDRAGLLPADRVAHVRFDEFMADQAAAVAAVHDTVGLSFDDADRDRIASYLADRPQGRHGGHEHAFDDLGLDLDDTRARFASYQQQFGIRSEDR